MALLYLCNFLIRSFYNLWYILSAAVTDFNGVTVKDFMYITYLLEGTLCLLIAKIFLPRLLFRLNCKVGWNKWFSVFFFWCDFAVNLFVCIAILLCNHIFSVLLHNLVLIVYIFQYLKNVCTTFNWCLSEVFNDLWWMIWWGVDVY